MPTPVFDPNEAAEGIKFDPVSLCLHRSHQTNSKQLEIMISNQETKQRKTKETLHQDQNNHSSTQISAATSNSLSQSKSKHDKSSDSKLNLFRTPLHVNELVPRFFT
jgi:hypothetical protein